MQYMIEHGMGAYDFDALSVTSGAVVGLTVAKLIETLNGRKQKAWKVLLIVETASVRFRCDGGTVTTTTGMLLQSGNSLIIEGYGNLVNLGFIAPSTTATVDVTYFYKTF